MGGCIEVQEKVNKFRLELNYGYFIICIYDHIISELKLELQILTSLFNLHKFSSI